MSLVSDDRGSRMSVATIPAFNPTVARVTLRGLLGRRRVLLLLPPALLLIALVIPVRNSSDVDRWTVNIVGELGVGVILPLAALILGTSVLGSEIDDGSIIQLLTKPLPRLEIVLTKWLVAFAVTVLFTAVPVFLASVVATGELGGLTLGFTVGAIAEAAVYCAIFVALGLLTRRAVAVGLVYVLLWEGLLADLLAGTRVFSVQQYAMRFADSIAASTALEARVSLLVAVIMSIVITVLGLAVAAERLRSFSLKGDAV
jgi:ABC-2 type transport system permease protein